MSLPGRFALMVTVMRESSFMQITTRKSVLAALVASLAVSLAAPMASAQGTRSACVMTSDGARKCDGAPAQKAQPRNA